MDVMQLPQKNPSYPSGHVPDVGTGFDAQRSRLCGHGSGLDRQRELASSLVSDEFLNALRCHGADFKVYPHKLRIA